MIFSFAFSLTAKHGGVPGRGSRRPSGSGAAHCKVSPTGHPLLVPGQVVQVAERGCSHPGMGGQVPGRSLHLDGDLSSGISPLGTPGSTLRVFLGDVCLCRKTLPQTSQGTLSEARNETRDRKLTQSWRPGSCGPGGLALLLTRPGATESGEFPEIVGRTQDPYQAGTTSQLKCHMPLQKEGRMEVKDLRSPSIRTSRQITDVLQHVNPTPAPTA